MKSLKNYPALIFSIMLVLGLTVMAKAELVGHWTFEDGEELIDLTGNFPELILNGAEIEDGALNTGVGAWAVTADNYDGPDITEKTMVSFCSIDDLSVLVRRGEYMVSSGDEWSYFIQNSG